MTTTHLQIPVEQQLETIRRGAEKILPDESALRERIEKAQAEGRPLRVKLGIDGTFTDLTLGHTVPLRNLRRFQDLGHQAVLVIGDYTATVGDPSGRSKARPPLTHDQVLANVATYQEQAARIIDPDRTEVVYNSEWLKELTFARLIQIGAHVSVKRMLQGEYFGRRFDDPDQTVFLHEMFYPIMQGLDSVAIRADIELGGTDQEFNCLMGRDMQRLHDQEPQVVVTNPLLLGLTGADKMSKSLGNFVGVAWPAQEQFNRLMAMSDDRMPEYCRLLTELPEDDIERRMDAIARGEADPRQVKKELVTAIVAGLHGESEARQAAAEYELYAELRRGGAVDVGLPAGLREVLVTVKGDGMRLAHVLVGAGLAASNGEAKRLIAQGGVILNREVVKDPNIMLRPGEAGGNLLQVGKRPPVVLREAE